MVWMKTLFFRESDCGAYDFAARKKRDAEKKTKGRSPFRDSPARVSTEMRVFFRAVRCRKKGGRNVLTHTRPVSTVPALARRVRRGACNKLIL